jgi:hypothetical protein
MVMKQVAFFEAFAFNPRTLQSDIWKGTATLDAINKTGPAADLSHPLYGDEKLAVDGWGYKAR